MPLSRFTRAMILAWALTLALLALVILLGPSWAHATASVRVEFQHGGHVYATQDLSTTGSTPATTSGAPSFSGVAGQARVTVTGGAAIITWGPGASATQTNGVRLEASQGPLIVPVNAGDVISIVEATEGPTGADSSSSSATTSGTPCLTYATSGCSVADIVAEAASILASLNTNSQLGTAADGSTAPTTDLMMGAKGSGNINAVVQGDTPFAIAISSATTTQIIAGVSGKKTYITAYHFTVSAADNVNFVYGTGTNCGTIVGYLTGSASVSEQFAANGGLAEGNGLGTTLGPVPAGDSVCMITSTSAQVGGSGVETQF